MTNQNDKNVFVKADYSSEAEKQTVRRYVEEAWKRTGLGKEEKVPKSLFLLA